MLLQIHARTSSQMEVEAWISKYTSPFWVHLITYAYPYSDNDLANLIIVSKKVPVI